MTPESRARARTLTLWVPLVLLAACATPNPPKAPPVALIVQAPGKTTLDLDERQDGASVTLGTAQGLRVELPTDAAAVNADMSWRVVLSAPGVLDDLGSRFDRRTRDNNPTEAGGTTVWRLMPKGPGRVALSFELRKPYSLDPPLQTLHYDVTVK